MSWVKKTAGMSRLRTSEIEAAYQLGVTAGLENR